jgi:hypothetical protein
VNHEGNVVNRFEPTEDLDDIKDEIKKLLWVVRWIETRRLLKQVS